jgi:hypothetical protein
MAFEEGFEGFYGHPPADGRGATMPHDWPPMKVVLLEATANWVAVFRQRFRHPPEPPLLLIVAAFFVE